MAGRTGLTSSVSQSFVLASPRANSLIVMLPLFLILGGLMIMLLWMLLAIPKLRFEVHTTGLTINFPFYGRTIPLTELNIRQARRLNFAQEPELRPGMRLNGLSIPGFQGGWFLLKNRQKALLFLSDANQAVCIPTTRGYPLILSPAQPEQFLQALTHHPQ